MSFFAFQTGDSSRATHESSPLLGRFRAVPDAQRQGNKSSNSLGRKRSIGRGLSLAYGSVFGGIGDVSDDDSDDGHDGILKRVGKGMNDLWLDPKQGAVAQAVDKWWTRWAVLAVLPAALAVAWCALPFPQYPLPEDDGPDGKLGHQTPGHGAARTQINFWFFLFVYYGFYNLTALMWITKVFNIYSLNWWPSMLGFPVTISMIAVISIGAPIPIYFIPDSGQFTRFNTGWICWTFFTMAMPLIIAFIILLSHERHLGLRQTLSESQRIFTTSWWTGDQDSNTIAARDRARRPLVRQETFDPRAPLEVALASDDNARRGRTMALRDRKRWIPASFMRFIWFCTALFIGMLAYVLGEAYAEVYLRTLPHNTFETLVYVYSWVVTVHLLDGLVGWILGGNEGERVGSYPLGWIFKLYFSLTYQTYVRALYARLRSYKQFVFLQLISSSALIAAAPITLSAPFHKVLNILSINNQSLSSYQKFCARNIYIRSLSENVSMLAFLGSILVLHYGANKNVYPYFAFDKFEPGDDPPAQDRGDDYDFARTFYAALVTWGCEIVAGWIVRRTLWWGWKVDVTGEGKQDLGMWPELLPTGVVVMVHVLQNMLFSIVRINFH